MVSLRVDHAFAGKGEQIIIAMEFPVEHPSWSPIFINILFIKYFHECNTILIIGIVFSSPKWRRVILPIYRVCA
jgi:hypothetical protein